MHRLRLLVLFFIAGIALWAQRQMTVEQLKAFVRSSVQMKNDDRQVADFIRKVKLTNRLDERTVEEMQGLGIGARTLAALKDLIPATATLAAPPPPTPPVAIATIPPPDSVEQKRILAEITQNALDYNRNLPNFICTQVTRRHGDPTGQENWRTLDTIQERLSYNDEHEDYKVVLVNNRPVSNVEHEQLGGATSSGEFGSMLAEIFSPETHTEFEWERWATLRGRRMYVYSFRVPQRYSKYSIYHQGSGRKIITGYHGLIYADREGKNVMRIKLDCDGIPPDYPIQQVSLDLNYDFTEISGKKFVLPLKADLRSREGRFLVWNEVEFHLYRKFETGSTITFDTSVDAIPEDQLKETPAVPDAQQQ
jgi:hypothetical protein